jgi:hypothetical protein
MIKHYGKIQRMTKRLSHRRPCLLCPCASQNDWENHKITKENTKWLSTMAKFKKWLSKILRITDESHKMIEENLKIT